jgi:hypothetical protein
VSANEKHTTVLKAADECAAILRRLDRGHDRAWAVATLIIELAQDDPMHVEHVARVLAGGLGS